MPRRPLAGNPRVVCDNACHLARGSLGGTDYAVVVGTSVFAPFSGTLTYRTVGTGGWTVIIHSDTMPGTVAELMHQSACLVAVMNGPAVHVTEGELVSLSGGAKGAPGSGNSTGPHLHAHVTVNGHRTGMEEFLAAHPAGTGTQINEQDDIMKIISPHGLPDKAVIGAGIGYAFTDYGVYSHFCNVWNIPKETDITIVGGPSWTAAQNRAVFNTIVGIHRDGGGPRAAAPTVDTAALAKALAPLVAGGASADAIAAKVEAILADDFAAVAEAIPTEFTITGK